MDFWLKSPEELGHLKVRDVFETQDAEEHLQIIEVWVKDVWDSWNDHHAQARKWVAKSLSGKVALP